jgi:hypothetical protein
MQCSGCARIKHAQLRAGTLRPAPSSHRHRKRTGAVVNVQMPVPRIACVNFDASRERDVSSWHQRSSDICARGPLWNNVCTSILSNCVRLHAWPHAIARPVQTCGGCAPLAVQHALAATFSTGCWPIAGHTVGHCWAHSWALLGHTVGPVPQRVASGDTHQAQGDWGSIALRPGAVVHNCSVGTDVMEHL